ncbi:hypothetical protein LCM20_14290 [Halobacillus litoralis]|uniref:hypothetical protein n=1 Tax=Halobacillus litoralis TaxID=45668 RepID=UPI001CD41EB1|nr:hypothetical protein [Halobacillus litoralis]MCA0971773.1 hypothetical protein [Halobacillus litoralis]
MTRLKKSLVWIGPLLIVAIGISLLFIDNYKEVVEEPSEGWSRDLLVGTTANSKEMSISTTEDGHYSVSFITNDGVRQNVYDQSLELIEENTYSIPVDKFTEVFLTDKAFLFSDYYAVYEGETEDKISDIKKFYPLKEHAFFRKENQIYEIQNDSLEPRDVLTIGDDDTQVLMQESENGVTLLTNDVSPAGNQLTFYSVSDGQSTQLGTADFSLNGVEEVRDINYTLDEESYSLIVQTLQKQSMSGKMMNHYYYAEGGFDEALTLNKIELQDPAGSGTLDEITDVEMKRTENGTEILFKAFGSTQSMFQDTHQFNIYEAGLAKGETPSVKRLSNTPKSSFEPAWLSSDKVIWLDYGSDGENRILASSGSPEIIEKADHMTKQTFLQALGKTLGMLSSGLFALVVSLIWFIWPLLFLCVVMFTNSKAMDNDRSWVFYVGAFIYLAASLIFQDFMFSSQGMAQAPDYLMFPGSSFIYLIGFALLSFAILQTGSAMKKWSPAIELTYFIGIHIAFITIFFGPYLL